MRKLRPRQIGRAEVPPGPKAELAPHLRTVHLLDTAHAWNSFLASALEGCRAPLAGSKGVTLPCSRADSEWPGGSSEASPVPPFVTRWPHPALPLVRSDPGAQRTWRPSCTNGETEARGEKWVHPGQLAGCRWAGVLNSYFLPGAPGSVARAGKLREGGGRGDRGPGWGSPSSHLCPHIRLEVLSGALALPRLQDALKRLLH